MAENKTRHLNEDQALAQARYVRVTPMKARRVIDMIRGMKASEAQVLLRFAEQAAAEPVGKVLASAMANAVNKDSSVDPDTLWVSSCYVEEGPTLKRFRPRAQGRAFRIRKRTSHIIVVVEPRTAPAARTAPAKSKSRSS